MQLELGQISGHSYLWRFTRISNNRYDEINKRIGEYVGRIYSKDMKVLVVSNKEANIIKPDYPTGEVFPDHPHA